MDSATEPRVAVCIPWRSQPHRIAAYERVKRWYEENGYWIVEGDSDPKRPFNLAAARNDAVRGAGYADIVIIADADTIPNARNLARAVKRAHNQRVIYPFTEYVYMEDVDPATVEDFDAVPAQRVYAESVGGLCVMMRELYWRLGGFDDCFMQWGYEDSAFQLVAETLAQVERYDGKVYAFSHEAERDVGQTNPGWYRMRLYRFARRDPKIMEELIKRW